MKKLTDDKTGLIVPMNIEAMCVAVTVEPVYEVPPYNFARLPDADDTAIPNVSDTILTGGGVVNMQQGVHLHWALPDALTHGESPQNMSGGIRFPAVPDRWLVTRVFCDLSDETAPKNLTKSWIIESNYCADAQIDDLRPSISVPFKTEDNKGQQYRYLGRVYEYENWSPATDSEDYVNGLTAVGYGIPEFAAYYHTCRSVFGFYDKATDLADLGTPGHDKILNYHVVGWYSHSADDPVNQPPVQLDPVTFDELLQKIAGDTDKNFFRSAYSSHQENGPYILAADFTADEKTTLHAILMGAGFDFADYMFTRCAWSVPLGTAVTGLTHSIYTGVVEGILWNETHNYIREPDHDISIAVGDTASEALAALIANLSGLEQQPAVELVLDALQSGLLQNVTNAGQLDRMEKLQLALHQNSFSAVSGGEIWQVSLKSDGDKGSGEVSLDDSLADLLNDLNELQSTYEKNAAEINSMRTQIFMDWYRFMLVLRREAFEPSHGLNAGNIQAMIVDRIAVLNGRIAANTTTAIQEAATRLSELLPLEYEIKKVSSPRYWQPAEPVVLFQGKGIDPLKRFGGDGRFMADDTLVVRTTSQPVDALTIAASAIGNSAEFTITTQDLPQLPSNPNLAYASEIYAAFAESCFLNPFIMAVVCLRRSDLTFDTITDTLTAARNTFLQPGLPEGIPTKEGEEINDLASAEDRELFERVYTKTTGGFTLNGGATVTADELKRIDYLLVSTGFQPGMRITYSGIAPSPVYVVTWDENPWLPFLLSWTVSYFPFQAIPADGTENYPQDFIEQNFKLGDVTYTFNGPVSIPTTYESYRNTIFLSPHAEENFQTQIRAFIDSQPDSAMDTELQAILDSLKDFPPILSQSLNGLNEAMIMRNNSLQLLVKDPVRGSFYSFTNNDVKDAVGDMGQSSPSPGNYYNPVRAGVMKLNALTIIDVFGRNISMENPAKIIRAEGFKAEGLGGNELFLSPRIVQASRLQFRWLAANNNAIEMNTHPATTPVCGWLLCNHLDLSLWLYTNAGDPLGSLILSEDTSTVLWQAVPGSGEFGMPISEYFTTGPGKDVNAQFKELTLALYNEGNGTYLSDFMKANDRAASLVQPENFKQLGSNAVLMGSPIAVAQAMVSLELQGLPAPSLSWDDMTHEVNEGALPNEHGFTKVRFPIRLGALEQANDGMLGYFKDSDYGHYYTEGATTNSARVQAPSETNISLSASGETSHQQRVTILLDPRGAVNATSGILPVKTIDIPPDQYADALQTLELAFLTTPVLTNAAQLAFPVPSIGNGEWSWLENERDKWSEAKEIGTIDDQALFAYSPQRIREGWLRLTNPKPKK